MALPMLISDKSAMMDDLTKVGPLDLAFYPNASSHANKPTAATETWLEYYKCNNV